MKTIIAIDVEKANSQHSSICEIAAVRVENGSLVLPPFHSYVRPPTREFGFQQQSRHGLSWADVRESPTWRELWPDLRAFLGTKPHLAAHNYATEYHALRHSCEEAGFEPPLAEWTCTMLMARDLWNIRPSGLNVVCETLGIPLVQHHSADHDAVACAKIIMRAQAEGRPVRKTIVVLNMPGAGR